MRNSCTFSMMPAACDATRLSWHNTSSEEATAKAVRTAMKRRCSSRSPFPLRPARLLAVCVQFDERETQLKFQFCNVKFAIVR